VSPQQYRRAAGNTVKPTRLVVVQAKTMIEKYGIQQAKDHHVRVSSQKTIGNGTGRQGFLRDYTFDEVLAIAKVKLARLQVLEA
jgi:hypothetical protein